MLDNLKAWVGAPHTRKVGEVRNPCRLCGATCTMYCHFGSMMNPEMMVIKCPKHGEIKRLYSKRPEPRGEASYWQWLTGDVRKRQLEDSLKRWV